METIWFCILAAMLTTYVVLDGFDLGAGLLHLWIAKTPAERATIIRAVGPVWDGNEVWLLASGGAIFVAFPTLLATAFSGFYLPLMMLLWLLTGRALGIEFRHQLDHSAWTGFWDVVFSLSSGLLALFLGVALGNVVRGVPIHNGTFFAPLWRSFEPGSTSGVLDAYTVLAGLTAVAALAHHGALWIAVKTDGVIQERARRAAKACGWATVALLLAATVWTHRIQPNVPERFAWQPWGHVFPLAAAAALGTAIWMRRHRRDTAAFLASCGFLVAMLATVAFSLYPYMLPSTSYRGMGSLTVFNAAAPVAGLKTALWWWIPGMIPVLGYFVFVYHRFAGKIGAPEDGY